MWLSLRTFILVSPIYLLESFLFKEIAVIIGWVHVRRLTALWCRHDPIEVILSDQGAICRTLLDNLSDGALTDVQSQLICHPLYLEPVDYPWVRAVEDLEQQIDLMLRLSHIHSFLHQFNHFFEGHFAFSVDLWETENSLYYLDRKFSVIFNSIASLPDVHLTMKFG